eukprot:1688320-Prymnesium_polylepis.1
MVRASFDRSRSALGNEPWPAVLALHERARSEYFRFVGVAEQAGAVGPAVEDASGAAAEAGVAAEAGPETGADD